MTQGTVSQLPAITHAGPHGAAVYSKDKFKLAARKKNMVP